MAVMNQQHLADIGNLVYQDGSEELPHPSGVLPDEFDQDAHVEAPSEEIEVELAIYSKGHGLLSPMQVFEIIFSETIGDQLPEYPDCNGYYVIQAEERQGDATSNLDLWTWNPFSTRNKLYYRCISKHNTIIAIEAFQEEAEDLTEAPKYYINKRDRSTSSSSGGGGVLLRHYVDAVHVYRICRKADIHASNPNFRRHVMWVEAIEPSLQDTPTKKVIEYMWKGKAKPDSLHAQPEAVPAVFQADNTPEDELTSTPRKKLKLQSAQEVASPGFDQRVPSLFKVHVSNLDPQVTDSDISDLFADFGPMKFHAVHYSRSAAMSLCSAEVHYASKQAVEDVVKQYNGVPLDGWPLCLAPINPAGELPKIANQDIKALIKVHVSNLGPEITDDRLSEVFSIIGGTKRCVVHHSATGKSLGTGEVTFETLKLAAEAIKQFDHSDLDGWPLRLAIIGNLESILTPSK